LSVLVQALKVIARLSNHLSQPEVHRISPETYAIGAWA